MRLKNRKDLKGLGLRDNIFVEGKLRFVNILRRGRILLLRSLEVAGGADAVEKRTAEKEENKNAEELAFSKIFF